MNEMFYLVTKIGGALYLGCIFGFFPKDAWQRAVIFWAVEISLKGRATRECFTFGDILENLPPVVDRANASSIRRGINNTVCFFLILLIQTLIYNGKEQNHL